MRIDFPYPGYEQIRPCEVPDANLMGVFGPHMPKGIDEGRVLDHGFANPIGARMTVWRWSDCLRSSRRAGLLPA